MKSAGFMAVSALLVLSAAPAQATLLNFTISGDYNATFELDSSPVPFDSYPDSGFAVMNVSGLFNGVATTVGIQFFLSPPPFSIDDPVAGLLIVDPVSFDWLLDGIGAQLFTGTEFAPTFRTGSFALISGGTLRENYVLTVSEAPVPEPTSWALMIAGFTLAGGALRARKARIAFV